MYAPWGQKKPPVFIGIGMGGISEGWMPGILLYAQLGILRFSKIRFVDGKKFDDHNKDRQNFRQSRNKAEDRARAQLKLYPDLELVHDARFVSEENVAKIVKENSVVLCSPDNHPTRALLSRHVETLKNALLIVGGNGAIDEGGGHEGWVAAYFRKGGKNYTPPITTYHEYILKSDERLPHELSCQELAIAGQPQVLATNLFVGQFMAWLTYRYLMTTADEAVEVVDVIMNSKTGAVRVIGIQDRWQGTDFKKGELR